ncbi:MULTISPECIES: hypothetical protein [Clostridium]|uniref:Uncharacterized protein n=1 Tax=Clostridium frigoriphilum TaxID=443253 RepID=A0ABU7UWZ3_9CLOT|nr:hypothetical protein [Clostridium sp. DSM 17811]MBU3102325.1 hypothetical protein [Clostridium sp. DSM 17811]
MNKEYQKHYKITDDGRDEIKYEDSSCSIILTVADFRDKVWWISANNVLNKNSGQLEKITRDQKYEVFKRVSAYAISHGVEGVYTKDFKFINIDIESIDYFNNIIGVK